jgi:hypothetical protein
MGTDEKYEPAYIFSTTRARKLGGAAAIQCSPAAGRAPFSIDWTTGSELSPGS